MNSKFPNVKVFINDTVAAHIVNLRDYFRAMFDKFKASVQVSIADIYAQLIAHINNKNNPHAVKPKQIFTISAFPPSPGQGQPGDVHIQYRPETID